MSRRILLSGILVPAVPLALVLNEIFGMPPAFTAPLAEPVPVAGVWSGTGITLAIAPDGSVFGTFGQDQIYRARIRGNRTWVGRALRLRTEYIIEGQVGQNRFTAPFNICNGRIQASFFVLEDHSKPGPASVVLDRNS